MLESHASGGMIALIVILIGLSIFSKGARMYRSWSFSVPFE
jgi:hypothetical protein